MAQQGIASRDHGHDVRRNILFLKGNYDAVGGAETLLGSLLDHLDPERFHAMLVMLQRNGFPDSPALLKDPRVVERHTIMWLGVAAAPLTIPPLLRLIRRKPVDLVNSHDIRSILTAAMLAPVVDLPWVAHLHGFLGAVGSRQLQAFEAIAKLLIRRADAIVCSSEAAAAELRTSGQKNIRVVANGVSLPERVPCEPDRSALRVRLGVRSDAILCGVLTRLHPGKGVAYLLEAIASLRRTGVALHLLVVGDGEERPVLEKQAQSLGLEDAVHFVGFQTDVAGHIAAMDILVHPSLRESLPLAILEGMAHGRPVVATAVGDVPKVLAGVGLVVPPADAEALAAAIASLVGDSERRRTMGEQGRRIVESRYSMAVATRALEDIFDEVIENKRNHHSRSGGTAASAEA